MNIDRYGYYRHPLAIHNESRKIASGDNYTNITPIASNTTNAENFVKIGPLHCDIIIAYADFCIFTQVQNEKTELRSYCIKSHQICTQCTPL